MQLGHGSHGDTMSVAAAYFSITVPDRIHTDKFTSARRENLNEVNWPPKGTEETKILLDHSLNTEFSIKQFTSPMSETLSKYWIGGKM